MNYLLVENLSKSFGEKNLFSDISICINRGDKTALIAKNGAGKTTLLNIIVGKDIQDDGSIHFHKDVSVSYLEQSPSLPKGERVQETLFKSNNRYYKALTIYKEAVVAYEKISSDANQKALSEAISENDRIGAWDYDIRCQEVLQRLKIDNLNQLVDTLSGGQQKKIALAQLLIDEADLLILDEPTNHLDLSMIEWLESYLAKTKTTLLMVTHDRYFLDSVCDNIIELDNNTLHSYKGNYGEYLLAKNEREEQLIREIDKAKNLYRTELEWMRRMPQARATKSKARINAFYDVEKNAKTKIDNSSVTFTVAGKRLGKKILELENIAKSFENIHLFKTFSYVFKRGDKIGVVGKNGCGKSTLMGMITQHIAPDTGTITKGETVKFGYFKQGGYLSESDKRVIDVVREVAETIETQNGTISAGVFLQHFGFSPAEQHAWYSTLSGGEKRKLYLLTVLMQNPNFLILDEPTNNLDIETMNALESFLTHFNGCILVISHDRWFLDKIAEHIFAFEEEQQIRIFPGNYTQYIEKRKIEKSTSQAKVEKPKKQKPKSNKISGKYTREFALLDEEMSLLETQREEIEKLLHSGSLPAEELILKSEEHATIVATIESKTDRWLTLAEMIDGN